MTHVGAAQTHHTTVSERSTASGTSLPCRYQLCLFCFDRIKLECSNLCPGCRTEYGSEKDPFQKGEARQRGGSASSSAGQTPHKPRLSPGQRQSPSHHTPPAPPSPNPGRRRHGIAAQSASEALPGPLASPSHQQRAAQQQQRALQSSSPDPAQARQAGAASASPSAQGASAFAKEVAQGLSCLQLGGAAAAGPALSSRGVPSSEQSSPSVSAGNEGHQGGADEGEVPGSAAGVRPLQGALHGAARKLGWGCWQQQKRRAAPPAADPEVRSRAALMQAAGFAHGSPSRGVMHCGLAAQCMWKHGTCWYPSAHLIALPACPNRMRMWWLLHVLLQLLAPCVCRASP